MWKLLSRLLARTPPRIGPARPESRAPAPNVPDDTDFITVDDGGTFTYYYSAGALCQDFEYAGQAEAVLDRDANQYPLILDENRRIILGHSIEKADLSWLRRAWHEIQETSPRLYPLRRGMPDTDQALMASLFEILELTAGYGPAGRLWTVVLDGRVTHLESLPDLTTWLSGLTDLSGAVVKDPYGHLYRPTRADRRGPAISDRHRIAYIETSARKP